MKTKRVILSVSNDISLDRRVEKECMALQELGFEPIVVGRLLPNSKPLDKPFKTKRFKLWFNKGALFYAALNIRLFVYLLFAPKAILHANDLDTLLANFLVSKLRGLSLVYDSHELFTEVPEIQHRPMVKKVWLAIEGFIFPKLKHVFTVNKAIADIYEAKYKVPVAILRNVPIVSNLEGSVQEKPASPFTVIMQGAGINVDRGAEELVQSAEYLPNDFRILIVGSGDAWPNIEKLLRENPHLAQKVSLKGKVPYKQLLSLTKNAHIGVSLDKPTNLNYKYSLPNKLFDYCLAQTPVLVSSVPVVAGIVEAEKCGWVLSEVRSQVIAQKLIEIKNAPEAYKQAQENCISVAKKYNWENEKKVLQNVYKTFL